MISSFPSGEASCWIPQHCAFLIFLQVSCSFALSFKSVPFVLSSLSLSLSFSLYWFPRSKRHSDLIFLVAAGWGCFQMGCGRKVEDPEPGRCRRTDGKKWRCSKEACPDSKYCEKHMHRGKRSSRKHVDLSLASNPTSSRLSFPYSPLLSLSPPEAHHVLFPSSSSSESPSMGFSPQYNIPYSHLDTVSLSADRSNRY